MSAPKRPRPTLAFNVEKEEVAAVAAPTPTTESSATIQKAVPAHRANRKVVQVWLNPAAYRQLKLMAARGDTSMQDELLEALDDLFQKRGEHRIARADQLKD